MGKKIRIVVYEPEPGWWAKVKAEARRRGMLVSGFVVACVRGELEGKSERKAPPALETIDAAAEVEGKTLIPARLVRQPPNQWR